MDQTLELSESARPYGSWTAAGQTPRGGRPLGVTPRDEMIAVAPEMLDLLKKTQELIGAGLSIGVDGVYRRQVIDMAEGRS